MKNPIKYIEAKFNAFAPLSCFKSPRPDIVRGWLRWRWLTTQRRGRRLIDPSVEIRLERLSRINLAQSLSLQAGCALDRGCILWMGDLDGQSGGIDIGRSTYIGPYTYLGSCHTLKVGDDSMIGAHSYLITVNHASQSNKVPYSEQGYVGGDIFIGDNVWLGCHVVVLPGVTIGDGAIVGAGAVVTKSIPAGETWGGVPARKLKNT